MGEKDSDITITFETLFEVLMREKRRDDLQKLTPSFHKDTVDYLKQKTQDKEKANQRQIENIKKLIKEIYERRERKIINLALLKSRTPKLDFSEDMLNSEKILFESLVQSLDNSRSAILNNVVEARKPTNIKLNNSNSSHYEDMEEPEELTKTVRFLHPVPKFYGSDMEVYGPYEKEDMANLPTELAEVLILKKRAEEVNSE